MNRPSWDEYFARLAQLVSQRASCPRASVGAVIVTQEHRVLSTGYNGAPSGVDTCLDVGCDVQEGHCMRAVHAEMNAVTFAAKQGIALAGSTMYVYDNLKSTKRPQGICRNCDNARRAAGIVDVIDVNKILQLVGSKS